MTEQFDADLKTLRLLSTPWGQELPDGRVARILNRIVEKMFADHD